LGCVEAQFDFAYRKRQGYEAPQYAQRVISRAGKQDGLAWQNPDGTWSGPIRDKIAHAIEQGYNLKADPYHGHFFKVLKGQGSRRPPRDPGLRGGRHNDRRFCARRRPGGVR
jgi:Protein of unknown function (DUF2950)